LLYTLPVSLLHKDFFELFLPPFQKTLFWHVVQLFKLQLLFFSHLLHSLQKVFLIVRIGINAKLSKIKFLGKFWHALSVAKFDRYFIIESPSRSAKCST